MVSSASSCEVGFPGKAPQKRRPDPSYLSTSSWVEDDSSASEDHAERDPEIDAIVSTLDLVSNSPPLYHRWSE